MNFNVNIDQINEINKIFLETDVTKLSGTWKEYSEDQWIDGKVYIS